MSGHGFRGANRNLQRVFSEGALHCLRLDRIAKSCGSAMLNSHIQFASGSIFASASGFAHHTERAIAAFGRLRNVEGVAGHSVAHNFGQNFCAAVFVRARAFPELRYPEPSPTTDPSRLRVEKDGSHAWARHCAMESAFIAANPPMPMGVMLASAPPQIIRSASPR